MLSLPKEPVGNFTMGLKESIDVLLSLVVAGGQRNEFYQIMGLKESIDVEVDHAYKESSVGINFLPFIYVLAPLVSKAQKTPAS